MINSKQPFNCSYMNVFFLLSLYTYYASHLNTQIPATTNWSCQHKTRSGWHIPKSCRAFCHTEVFSCITSSLSSSTTRDPLHCPHSELHLQVAEMEKGITLPGHFCIALSFGRHGPNWVRSLATWGIVGSQLLSDQGSWAYIRMVNSLVSLWKPCLPA